MVILSQPFQMVIILLQVHTTVKIELRAIDISYSNTKTGIDCVEAQCALEEIDKNR